MQATDLTFHPPQRFSPLSWLWIIALSCLTPLAFANSIGTVIMARGDATAEDADGEVRSLSRRSEVNVEDQLSTGEQSRLQIRMVDDALLDLRSETELTLEVYSDATADEDSQVLMELVNGTLSSLTGQFGSDDEDNYELRSSNASIGIRGTSYSALYDPAANATYTSVDSGGVDLSNVGGSVPLGPDEAFSHGQAIADDPPEGLLTPPPALREALLDVDLVREEEEDEEEDEDEDDNGNGNGNGAEEDTASEDDSTAEGTPASDAASGTPATSAGPASPASDVADDAVPDDLPGRGPQNDNLSPEDLAPGLGGDEPESGDPRISDQVATDAETSNQLINTASTEIGDNQFGVWVFDEDERLPYLMLYNERTDLADGYVSADDVIRLTAPPVQETLLCGDTHELFCDQSQDWFWGYWDVSAEIAESPESSEYSELEEGVWILEVEADSTISSFDRGEESLFFFTDIGEDYTAKDSDGNPMYVYYDMLISSSGVVESAQLAVFEAIESGDYWYLSSEGDQEHIISDGELTIDDFVGNYYFEGENDDPLPASGSASGVFREDGNLYYFLGTFVTELDEEELSAAGVIISEEYVP